MNDKLKREALSLYRKILAEHAAKLPTDMRDIGDSYVKKEFRDHFKAKDTRFMSQFVTEWTKYYETLRNKQLHSPFGKHLDSSIRSKLSEDQKNNLDNLEASLKFKK